MWGCEAGRGGWGGVVGRGRRACQRPLCIAARRRQQPASRQRPPPVPRFEQEVMQLKVAQVRLQHHYGPAAGAERQAGRGGRPTRCAQHGVHPAVPRHARTCPVAASPTTPGPRVPRLLSVTFATRPFSSSWRKKPRMEQSNLSYSSTTSTAGGAGSGARAPRAQRLRPSSRAATAQTVQQRPPLPSFSPTLQLRGPT